MVMMIIVQRNVWYMCLPQIPHYLSAVTTFTNKDKPDYGIYCIHCFLLDGKIQTCT